MKQVLIWLVALPGLLATADAQTPTRLRKAKVNGQTVYTQETVAGSTTYDKAYTGTVPGTATTARIGAKVWKQRYVPEGKKSLNLAQFGTGKYFSPNYRFSLDFNPNQSIAERRAQGINLFSMWAHNESDFNTLPFGDGFIYSTESGLNGPYEGALYYERPLYELESFYQTTITGAYKGFWVANIENSNEWWPGNANSPLPGFPRGSYGQGKFSENWSSAQNKPIQLETTGETITLGQLAGRGVGAWEAEMRRRRTNRVNLMLEIARQRTPNGGRVAYGSSMYQGEPKTSDAYQIGVFQEGYGDVSKIGGDANGNITLNGRQYQLNGDIYSHETFHLDYYYQFYFHVSQADYQDIWLNQNPARMNYPAIWAAIKPRHVVADQKGHWQANRYRMKNRPGQSVRGSICMRELYYEADKAGLVDGVSGDNNLIGRVPANLGTGCLDFMNGGDPCDDQPKIWIPPYEMYSYYAVHRFLEGGTPGSGFHLFHAPGRFSFETQPGFNHEYHSVTALMQARHDLQPYEKFFDNSTLIEDPEVQIGATGAWSSYDGIQAYNYDGQGNYGPQKPSYSMRIQPQSGGFRVLIMGGMNQGWTTERTDNVRYQFPGMASPVVFQVKLRGPAAQFFEFAVKSTDAGQTYVANPTAVTALEKAGYAGRIN